MINTDAESAWNESIHSTHLPISDDERKEILTHQSADDIRIAEGTKPLDAFRKLALPPLILPTPCVAGLPLISGDQEVLKATWDEMVGMSLQDLLALRDTLQEIVGRFERTAQEFTDIIERQIRRIVKGDDESDILIEWWRFDLAEIESNENGPRYVPEAWRKLRSEVRSTLIGDRIKLNRIELTISATRFRLAICEHMITRIALFGAAAAWEETPKDELPVFKEPERWNAPKPYRAEFLAVLKQHFLTNGKRLEPAWRTATEETGAKVSYGLAHRWAIEENYGYWGRDEAD